MVRFIRTATRRYAVEARPRTGAWLRVDPAPGFDAELPHDMLHYAIEETLGLGDGVFGSLTSGLPTGLFLEVSPAGPVDHRHAARRRRAARRRVDARRARITEDMVTSERATLVAWHDWLMHTEDAARRQKAAAIGPAVTSRWSAMTPPEARRLQDAMPAIRARLDQLHRLWSGVEIEQAIDVEWQPTGRHSDARRSRR